MKRCSARSCCAASRRTSGGPTVGLAVVSIAFGAGHIVQGFDAAVATGMLGFVWGLMYLRRGSAVGPIVSHALYNGAQVLQLMLRAQRAPVAASPSHLSSHLRRAHCRAQSCSGGVVLTPARARNPCTHSATTASCRSAATRSLARR